MGGRAQTHEYRCRVGFRTGIIAGIGAQEVADDQDEPSAHTRQMHAQALTLAVLSSAALLHYYDTDGKIAMDDGENVTPHSWLNEVTSWSINGPVAVVSSGASTYNYTLMPEEISLCTACSVRHLSS
ncbi:hypothetical protein MUK42_03710 [Musa troglodytarum]|uniref:Uncharacterized protein n=1 Tax=Musa troglodytarum TaxID=320322 RepID=A0A9E7FUN0_9LILI|nr:hypothetical protein MUK42_03710 [Musa troglodytarum]